MIGCANVNGLKFHCMESVNNTLQTVYVIFLINYILDCIQNNINVSLFFPPKMDLHILNYTYNMQSTETQNTCMDIV